MYFLAIETTRRRLASTSSRLAWPFCCSPIVIDCNDRLISTGRHCVQLRSIPSASWRGDASFVFLLIVGLDALLTELFRKACDFALRISHFFLHGANRIDPGVAARSVMLRRPISCAISRRRRATLRRKRISFLLFLPRVAFCSARSLSHSFRAFL